ncbi:Piwi-domain-containing protein [Aureobasidium pullulans]|nr:Piwi-domain-containing protein [Aureobasidium pullulans]
MCTRVAPQLLAGNETNEADALDIQRPDVQATEEQQVPPEQETEEHSGYRLGLEVTDDLEVDCGEAEHPTGLFPGHLDIFDAGLEDEQDHAEYNTPTSVLDNEDRTTTIEDTPSLAQSASIRPNSGRLSSSAATEVREMFSDNTKLQAAACRRYNGMPTRDWWWETQEKISQDRRGGGATIVPLIVASDKTMLTLQSGDLAAHAVFLSIGNLRASARHSNERPGSILLGLIPIVKEGDAITRGRIFHHCLATIFELVKQMCLQAGTEILCSDGWTRRYVPIIAVFTTDYEEQVKLTGILGNRHCTMCKIHPGLREDLELTAEWRSKTDTRERIQRQRKGATGTSSGSTAQLSQTFDVVDDGIESEEEEAGLGSGDESELDPDERIHDINRFALTMPLMDIHKSLMVDILHQLLKGVMMHVLGSTQLFTLDQARNKPGTRMFEAVTHANATKKRSAKANAKVAKSIVTGIVDRRFASIPKFATIRVFQHLSKILPVFVPLLEEVGTPEANAAIQFIRATVDFITLAMYQSHDDNTLRYFELALYRMNQRKEVFQKYRNPKAKDDEQHFDFPKWHSLTHYVQMIHLYGCAPNWDTNHPEHKHHTYANEGFRRTNKKNDWEDQLMEHHLRGINMLALQDTLCRGPRPTLADGRERDEEPVSVGEPQPIDLVFGLPGINRRTKKALWRAVRDIVELLGPEEGPLFRQAMAVFVRESRPYNREQPSNLDPVRVEPMDTWVNDYPVQLHHSIKCRKEHGDMTDDSSTTERNITRCARIWQKEAKPRHDWVWVQEYEAPAEDGKQSVAFQGRSPVRPRLIVTVEDIGVIHAAEHDMDQGEQANTRYSGVYCDVYVPKDPQGRAGDPAHGAALPPAYRDPSIYYAASNADPASFAREASQLAGNKHNSSPRLLMFILQDRNNITHGEIKRYCECKLGISPRCVQYAHVQKAPAQYISNVLMKFNAKLGGFSNTVFGPVTSKKPILDNSVVIIGADVSHAAPGLNGPSMAAMTVSMNDNATRYAAAIEASGHRVETITDETIENMEKHIISPIENGWSTQAGQGKIPATVVYFRDGISESQFA